MVVGRLGWCGRFVRALHGAVSASVVAFLRADGPSQAAALAFYAMLSCIPLFFVMLSAYGLVAGETWTVQLALRHQLSAMAPFFDTVLVSRVRKLLWASPRLPWASVVFILWSSWLFVGALHRALRQPWREDCPPVRSWPARLGVLVRGPCIGALFVVAMTVTLYCAQLPRLEPAGSLLRRLSAVWGVACLTGLFMAVYLLFLPVRRPLQALCALSAVLAGAAFAVSALFTAVVVKLPRYHLVYGSLSGAILFLLWLDYNVCLLLWGAWFLRCWQREHSGPAFRGHFALADWLARFRRRKAGDAAGAGERVRTAHNAPQPKS